MCTCPYTGVEMTCPTSILAHELKPGQNTALELNLLRAALGPRSPKRKLQIVVIASASSGNRRTAGANTGKPLGSTRTLGRKQPAHRFIGSNICRLALPQLLAVTALVRKRGRKCLSRCKNGGLFSDESYCPKKSCTEEHLHLGVETHQG